MMRVVATHSVIRYDGRLVSDVHLIDEQKPIPMKSSSPSIEFAPERKATQMQW